MKKEAVARMAWILAVVTFIVAALNPTSADAQTPPSQSSLSRSISFTAFYAAVVDGVSPEHIVDGVRTPVGTSIYRSPTQMPSTMNDLYHFHRWLRRGVSKSSLLSPGRVALREFAALSAHCHDAAGHHRRARLHHHSMRHHPWHLTRWFPAYCSSHYSIQWEASAAYARTPRSRMTPSNDDRLRAAIIDLQRASSMSSLHQLLGRISFTLNQDAGPVSASSAAHFSGTLNDRLSVLESRAPQGRLEDLPPSQTEAGVGPSNAEFARLRKENAHLRSVATAALAALLFVIVLAIYFARQSLKVLPEPRALVASSSSGSATDQGNSLATVLSSSMIQGESVPRALPESTESSLSPSAHAYRATDRPKPINDSWRHLSQPSSGRSDGAPPTTRTSIPAVCVDSQLHIQFENAGLRSALSHERKRLEELRQEISTAQITLAKAVTDGGTDFAELPLSLQVALLSTAVVDLKAKGGEVLVYGGVFRSSESPQNGARTTWPIKGSPLGSCSTHELLADSQVESTPVYSLVFRPPLVTGATKQLRL